MQPDCVLNNVYICDITRHGARTCATAIHPYYLVTFAHETHFEFACLETVAVARYLFPDIWIETTVVFIDRQVDIMILKSKVALMATPVQLYVPITEGDEYFLAGLSLDTAGLPNYFVSRGTLGSLYASDLGHYMGSPG